MKPREEVSKPLDYATPRRAHQEVKVPRYGNTRAPILPYVPLMLGILQFPCTVIVGVVLFMLCGDMGPVRTPGSLTPKAIVWITLIPSFGGILVGLSTMLWIRPPNPVDRVFSVVGSFGCLIAIIFLGYMAGK
jgi:hypothetical protein